LLDGGKLSPDAEMIFESTMGGKVADFTEIRSPFPKRQRKTRERFRNDGGKIGEQIRR
jgi:hypothetical protein